MTDAEHVFILVLSDEEITLIRKDLCEKAIATLIDMEHFVKANFKIIELSPAEVLTEVD